MRLILSLLTLWISILTIRAEVITLYNDNQQGGIHKTSAKTIVVDGQYYVDFPITTHNGKVRTERHKVYRVKDNARLWYQQATWAEKYPYVIESNDRTPYYFNMKSRWIPSLTQDPNDTETTIPQKKLTVMLLESDGRAVPMKVLLVKSQGTLMLYNGDEYFGYTIESNDNSNPLAPAWTRQYKYRSNISGFPVYFNISK